VTLTTDFGLSDGYVGAMKGVLASLAPEARVVDIAHDLAAQDVLGGAMALAQAAPYFPAGTVHVAVVDPGVGGPRAEVIVAAGGQLFVGPDNGLLALAAPEPRRVFRIAAASFRSARPSPTFHGRDIFAVAAGRLAAGAAPEAAGPELARLAPLPFEIARWAGEVIEGSVLHVDRFGNLLTSIATHVLSDSAGGVADEVELETPTGILRAPRVRTYADVAPGAALAYLGSSGWLELGLRDGSLAERSGARVGSRVRVRRARP
jgi:S-adenosylmethionine hydrolase